MKYKILILSSFLALLIGAYVYYGQSQLLAAQQDYIDIYRDQLQEAGLIIEERSEWIISEVEEFSHDFSFYKHGPLFFLLAKINLDFEEWLDKYDSFAAFNQAGQVVSIASVDELLSSTQDSITSFFQLHSQTFNLSDEIAAMKINQTKGLVEHTQSFIVKPEEISFDQYQQLKAEIVKLQFELLVDHASFFSYHGDVLPQYYPVLYYHKISGDSTACEVYLTEANWIQSDLAYLNSPIDLDWGNTKYGSVYYRLPSSNFNPLHLSSSFRTENPFTGEVIEAETSDGYFLFVKPE